MLKKLLLTATALCIVTPAFAGATYKIFGLPDGGSLQAGDGMEISRGGNGSYHLTGTELVNSIYGTAPGVSGQIVFNSNGSLATADPNSIRGLLGLGSLSTLSAVNNANWSGTALAIANGGTGATTQAGARSALALTPGTDVQSYSAELGAVSALSATGYLQRTGTAAYTVSTTIPYASLTGTPAIPTNNNQLTNGANFISALTGDVTATGPGSAAATLATVNSTPGTIGDSTHIPVITTDAKGRVTSTSTATVTSGVSSVYGRTGAVTAQTGDYSVGQVTGAAPSSGATLTAATVNGVTLTAAGANTSFLNAAGGYTTPASTGVAGLVYNDPSAATANTTAINNALAGGGQVSVSCSNATPTVYTNGTLVVSSNTRFTIQPNCIIKQASGTNNTMLSNTAALSAWTNVYDSTGSVSNGPLNLTRYNYGSWAATTAYTKGTQQIANGNIYWESAASCTSASSGGPTGTGTGITDGTCTWNYVTAATVLADNTPTGTASRMYAYFALLHFPFHGLTVGDFVWVTPQPDSGSLWTGTGATGALGGPADPAYFGVFYVAAVNDANYVTVQLRVLPPSQASFTGIPIKVKKADDNIVIDGGGTFDYNYAQNNAANTNYIPQNTAVLWGIHNLITSNINSINSFRYAFNIGAVATADIGRTQGGPKWTGAYTVNGDQVHVYGPAFDVNIHDINGAGYDDTAVLDTSENAGNGASEILGVGNVYRATIKNIGGMGGARVGVFQSQQSGLLRMEQVLIDNVEPFANPRGGYSTIFFGGNGAFNDITVQNSSQKNTGTQTPSQANPFITIYSNSSGAGITMDSLRLLNNNIVTPNNSLIQLTTGTSAPVTIEDLVLDHNTVANSQQVIGFALGTGALTINNLLVNDLNLIGNTGLMAVPTGSTINHTVISNSNFGSYTTANVINSVVGGDYTFAHNRLTGGNVLFDTNSNTATLRMIGNQLTGAYAVSEGSANPTIKLYSDGTNTLSGGGWFKYTAGASPTTVYGWDIQCDVTKMQRVTGSYCQNTNTAPGSGTLTTAGPIMDQGTTTGSWFAMSNPAGQTY